MPISHKLMQARIPLVAFGVLLLAGCQGGQSGPPPALKEGKWMISTSISNVEGVPEDQATAMKSMSGQYSLCVDPANAADGLRLVMGKVLNSDCTIKDFTGGSSAKAALNCIGSKGALDAVATGKITAEAIDLKSIDTATDAATNAKVATTMHVLAKTDKPCA